jgi:hypothetical protein
MMDNVWNPRLRHRYFLSWFFGNGMLYLGSLLVALGNADAGFGLAVIGIGFHIIANLTLWRAGRTTPWRSVPRLQDLPVIAAHRFDPDSGWRVWSVIDVGIILVMLGTVIVTDT